MKHDTNLLSLVMLPSLLILKQMGSMGYQIFYIGGIDFVEFDVVHIKYPSIKTTGASSDCPRC